MSKELNKALDLLREIRPSIPKDVLELWCKDRDAFLAQRSEFHQHLKECADEVATWPTYKQEALGPFLGHELGIEGETETANELNKAPVEQAGGDRWDALQSIMEWTAAENIPDDRKLCLIRNAARAALAIASSAQTEHERDMLGQALGECIEAAGITTPGTPLTGPQLLMFAADLKRDLQRAALAQPSLAHELDPLNLAPHAEAFNEAPAEVLKPEQAERPEVVAYRTIGRHEKHQHPHYALNYYKQNAEDQAAHWRERGCEVSEDELMTVAQHERIVKAWIERWKAYIELSAKIAAQRDAALARVAELELKLDQSDYAYDNDRHHMRGMAKQAAEAIQVFTGHDSGANLAHRYGEKWWEHLDELRDALLAFAKNAPPAQAQHSVPEEFIGRLSEFLAQRGATGKALLREMRTVLAAAPGKEVGHE
ncbi:conserved hypothetical protein [Pseudomonas phage D3]|uniref:Uncharacterized protein n=1 Tax=Pseudomonas phage D3 TaxID=2932880 RepID=Q9MC78_BPD3|nr:hypothetical protein D3p048 [Pseudomonas phage D3]AAF80803.1 conserved hypothetical protein [Pseudomonas phage D3]